MIAPILIGLALAALGTVVVQCIVRLTDPEPEPQPTFAAKYAAHIEQAQRRLRVEDFDAAAVEAFLTLPVEIPSQRRGSEWS